MHDLTLCVHHPAVNEEGYASLAVPTHRASTIVYPDGASFMARKYRGFDGYTYGLHGTPTTRTLEAQLTVLEPLLAERQSIDITDFILFPILRSLTIVKGVHFGPQAEAYLARVAGASGVDLLTEKAL